MNMGAARTVRARCHRLHQDGRSARRGGLTAPRLLAGVTLLILGGCGDGTVVPTPSLSLAAVPSAISFSVVARPTPDCCFILTAQWSLMVTASEGGDLESVSITLRDPVTGYVYVDRRSDRNQLGRQAPTHLEAGAPVAIPQALLETMPLEFGPAQPLQLRLEAVFRGNGQTVTAAIEPPFVAAPLQPVEPLLEHVADPTLDELLMRPPDAGPNEVPRT